MIPILLCSYFLNQNLIESRFKANLACREIKEAAKYINKNDVVLDINSSNELIYSHINGYLGIDKLIVLLNTYEAYCGWFPVIWNSRIFPKYKIGNQLIEDSKTRNYKEIINLNQIVFIGNDFQSNDFYKQIKTELEMNYQLVFTSTSGLVHSYKLK
ncbi:MAG: hypothetical protein IPP29_05070 [Bacteroidetes bacterium]|nr:hypothetical protein [Bacteroidota bacterium]